MSQDESIEDFQQWLQKWIDTEFLCPKCRSANNVIKVEQLLSCHCVQDCTVKLAMLKGQCNNCGINLIGIVETQRNDDGAKFNNVKHGIQTRLQRHANN